MVRRRSNRLRKALSPPDERRQDVQQTSTTAPLGLLFDLDGTLLMTDPIHVQVFADMFAQYGVHIDEDIYLQRLHGRLNADIFADLLPDGPDAAAMSEQKEAEFRRRLPKPFPAMPGANALIARAKAAGWGLAVVTNAPRANAEAMLAAIGLRDAFKIMIIGEECPRGKPHPDPYQAGMRALGLAPEHCIAFEDSPSGLRSAAAAGLRVVGIRSSLNDAALRAAGADLSLRDFADPALDAVLDSVLSTAA